MNIRAFHMHFAQIIEEEFLPIALCLHQYEPPQCLFVEIDSRMSLTPSTSTEGPNDPSVLFVRHPE
jgi:hypothetical protein